MNWEVIVNERSSLQEYRLIDHNDCKVILKYNPLHQSARITCGSHHRLFFLESTGSLSGKLLFKNEYGMEMGNLVHDRYHPKEGTVVIENKHYRYQLNNNPLPELVIYASEKGNPIASCSLQSNTAQQGVNFAKVSSTVDNNCFLLGLCLYLFLPQAQEQLVSSNPVNHQ